MSPRSMHCKHELHVQTNIFLIIKPMTTNRIQHTPCL